jgi:hypothetical protein
MFLQHAIETTTVVHALKDIQMIPLSHFVAHSMAA